MATNFYFQLFPQEQITNEQLLVEDLVIEAMGIYGMDVYYLPRSSRATEDYLYGEDTVKQYRSAHPIEMYLENVTGMDGEQDFTVFMQKAGLQIMATFGDYQLNVFEPERSDRLILVAQKHSIS